MKIVDRKRDGGWEGFTKIFVQKQRLRLKQKSRSINLPDPSPSPETAKSLKVIAFKLDQKFFLSKKLGPLLIPTAEHEH